MKKIAKLFLVIALGSSCNALFADMTAEECVKQQCWGNTCDNTVMGIANREAIQNKCNEAFPAK